MTSPVIEIFVVCPACGTTFNDWYRPSVNLDLAGWDPTDPEVAAYLRECESARCPFCQHLVELETLTITDGVWRFPSAAEPEQ